MLTLITGAPGTGKTATLVDLCSTLAKDRPLFVYGLAGFQLDHIELKDPSNWMGEVPDGAAIILDEAQTIWRPRGPGSKVPDHIAKLETHRHRGLDFFITTQGPNLIDANVRALVGRHIHMRDLGILGRWWYEWPECADNCRTGWRSAPIKKRFKLPKAAFKNYTSASLHVKPIRSFPVVLVVGIVALIATIALAFYAYKRITGKLAGANADAISLPTGDIRSAAVGSAVSPGRAPVALPVSRVLQELPRQPGMLHTAPLYDELRKARSVPYPAACVASANRCTCYTDQNTRLPVPLATCMTLVETGFYRDWIAPPSRINSTLAKPQASASVPPSVAARERVVPTLSRPDSPGHQYFPPVDVTADPAPSPVGLADASVIAFMRGR